MTTLHGDGTAGQLEDYLISEDYLMGASQEHWEDDDERPLIAAAIIFSSLGDDDDDDARQRWSYTIRMNVSLRKLHLLDLASSSSARLHSDVIHQVTGFGWASDVPTTAGAPVDYLQVRKLLITGTALRSATANLAHNLPILAAVDRSRSEATSTM